MEDQQHGRNKTLQINGLTNLPDCLIYKILSSMDTKYAVQTCVLSKEWKDRWTEVQTLNFEDKTFNTWKDFAKFVRRVLRKRKPFNLRRLRYICRYRKDKSLLDRICNYAIKHNLEELETDVHTFPPKLYECHTLKTLIFGPSCSVISKSPNPFGDFASLTTLQLFGVWLSYANNYNDLFPSCVNLKNLLLIQCHMFALETFNVTSTPLINLTISDLEDCAIGNKTVEISAPRLKCFHFKGKYHPILKANDCSSLDSVNIHFLLPTMASLNHDLKQSYLLGLSSTAEAFYHAKSLTVTFDKKFSLHRNRDILDTDQTRGIDINKEVGGEWWVDLTTLAQNLCKNGFVLKWQH